MPRQPPRCADDAITPVNERDAPERELAAMEPEPRELAAMEPEPCVPRVYARAGVAAGRYARLPRLGDSAPGIASAGRQFQPTGEPTGLTNARLALAALRAFCCS